MANQMDEIGKAFVQHYYGLFDANRSSLASLYQDASMLTFEGEPFMGQATIMGKLNSLSFQSVKHYPTTIDCQPSGVAGALIVFVSGNLVVDGNEQPLKFSQVFHLLPVQGGGSFWVHNDMFRLNYC